MSTRYILNDKHYDNLADLYSAYNALYGYFPLRATHTEIVDGEYWLFYEAPK